MALALNPDGEKDVLGLWIEQTEGAKFWLKVMNELRNARRQRHPDRGGRRAQGLSRGDRARCSRRPMVQTCIVHLIRNSLAFVSWKDRKAILPAIKAIYRAETAEHGAGPARRSSRPNGASAIRRSARPGGGAWEHVVPFFAFPPGSAR